MMRVPARIGSTLLLALIAGGPWASTSNAQLVTDPVGFFTVKFPGDGQLAFSPGLVNAVELFGPVAGVSGNRISFSGTAEESALERFSGGGHFSVYNGTTPGLNLDATGVTQSSPELIEITLSRAVDGLVSVGDLITLRSHTTLAQFFGEDNEAGIGGGTNAELADTIAIWDVERQASRIFYWHSSDGFVEAGKEQEGDKSAVPIRFPSGAMFTRRASTEISFTRAGHVLVPSEQQLFPVKQGTNLIACSLWTSDLVTFQFSDYRLYESGSPFSVRAGGAATGADVMIHTGMETGLVSEPIYYQSDAGGGHWQFIGGGDAGGHPVSGFAALQLFRSGADGFIKFSGTGIAPSPKASIGGARQDEIRFDLAIAGRDQFALSWLSRASATYQIQTRRSATGRWTDVGAPLVGSGEGMSKTIALAGSGEVRIIGL